MSGSAPTLARRTDSYPEDNPFDQMDWEIIHNSVTETRQKLGIDGVRALNMRRSILPDLQHFAGDLGRDLEWGAR